MAETQTEIMVDRKIAQLRYEMLQRESAQREIDNDEEKSDARGKFRSHIFWICVGCAIAIGLSHIPSIGWLSIPLGSAPSIALEIIDRINIW